MCSSNAQSFQQLAMQSLKKNQGVTSQCNFISIWRTATLAQHITQHTPSHQVRRK